MASLLSPPRDSVRLDALPSGVRRRSQLGALGEEPRPPERPAFGNAREREAPRPSRLPRNLIGLTVLVVDDDEATLEFFEAALGSCGARVTIAATAMEGVRLAGDIRPDVIVSDIAMPRHDGYWLVHEIRTLADDGLKSVPIVAATAFGQEHSRERVLTAGFTDHLRKPVDPDALCRAVARAAGR